MIEERKRISIDEIIKRNDEIIKRNLKSQV